MNDFIFYSWPILLLVVSVFFIIYDFMVYLEDKKSNTKAISKSIFNEGVILSRMGGQKFSLHIKVFFVSLALVFVVFFATVIAGNINELMKEGDIDVLAAIKLLIFDGDYTVIENFVLAVLFIVVSVVSYMSSKNERVILTKNEIKYCPVFKNKLFQRFNPSWSIRWSDVKTVYQGKLKAKNEIVIETKEGESHTLQLNAWKELGKDNDHAINSLIGRFKYQNKLIKDADFAFKENVLSRYIINVVGLDIEKTPDTNLNFDLTSNKHSLATLVVIFAFILYALISFMVTREVYISEVPYVWFAVIGLVIAIGCGVALAKTDVPLTNAWGMALLLGIVVSVAMYPAMININQLTDSKGLIEYEYQRVDKTVFESVDLSLPRVVVNEDEYWESIPLNKTVVFMIRKGGLDLYQVDMEPEYKKMRLWYCLKRAGDDVNKISDCNV